MKKRLLAVAMGAMMIPGSGAYTNLPSLKSRVYRISCELPGGVKHERTAHGPSSYMPGHAVRSFLDLCCPDYTLLSDFGSDAKEKGILFKAWCNQPEHTMDVYCKEIV